ncbi:uncharacterized protein LOC107365542 [Tetranychus urticae]|uniref:Uncharacterized protein n=1 Tax=Tetranychus urticae TaxID=32264 RepID=T1KMX6_TETUR|nr:uncharacterized protein LOC107365542 [Tetranychus urticae]
MSHSLSVIFILIVLGSMCNGQTMRLTKRNSISNAGVSKNSENSALESSCVVDCRCRCPESQQRSTNPIHDGIDQIPEQIHNAFSSQIREADIIPETAWLSII